MPERWLVVSYFTGIDGMAVSLHADLRIAELRRRGHEVLVLTSAGSPPGPGVVRVPSLSPSGLRYEMRLLFRRRARTPGDGLLKAAAALGLAPFYLLEKSLLQFDPTWFWFLTARGAAVRAARRFHPRVVYSTGGPSSAHLAGIAAAREEGARLVAEFQDPLRGEGDARSRLEARCLARLEREVAREADAVVYLVDETRKRAEGRVPFRGVTATIRAGAVLPSPPPGSSRPGAAVREKIVLSHFGTLAETRTLRPLLEGVAELGRTAPEKARAFKVVQHGHASPSVRREVEAWPGGAAFAGRLPHAEALAAMAGAQILLLVQDRAEISSLSIPSKVYEYLLTGRPVLGLVHRNPELRGMLESCGHLAAELSDPAEVARALERLADSLEGKAAPLEPKPSPFTVEAAVDALESLAGGRGARGGPGGCPG